VRRLFPLVAVLFAIPVAVARPDDPASALTLTGPGATTYGHEIDFVGRLTPAVAGQRVRLLRGTYFVAATSTNAAGGFRFKVAIARPGPFHVEASGVASPPVTVRIVPYLDASLVGARVAGSPLSREDAWQRAVELLFERLALRWEIAGAPIVRQRELLARLRAASPEERAWVRQTLREHCAEHFPEVQAP